MSHPCNKRHRLVLNGRFVLADRCRAGLLWWTIARASVQGKKIQLDDKPYTWDRALPPLEYLKRTAHPKWWRDLE